MASDSEVRDIFLSLDTDGDGWINQTSDLAALLGKIGVADASARPLVAGCVSNPHYINFEEVCNLLSKLATTATGPSDAEVTQEMFQMFDTDFDGYITVADVRALFSKASIESMGLVAPATEAELAAMIADADTDGDGRLSLDDFKAVLEQVK